MRTFVELVERYADPELCPYPEYKGKPYYSIKYIENGEEYVGYGTYSLRVMSEFLKKYFILSALEKQEQSNAQNVNSTHRVCPNALESLNILEQAKDDKGCVPMSLVRRAFQNVMEQAVDKCCETCKHKDRLVSEWRCSECFRASNLEDYYEPYTEEES